MKPQPIIGYEGRYVIYPNGDILRKSHKFRRKEIFLKPSKQRYIRVTLTKDGSPKIFSLHRLLAIQFIPNPENKPTVNHKDGNNHNNSLDNLEWATFSENNIHSIEVLGRKRNTEKQRESARKFCLKKRKLTMKQVKEIRTLFIKKTPRKDMSRIYGVSLSSIDKIVQGKTYREEL